MLDPVMCLLPLIVLAPLLSALAPPLHLVLGTLLDPSPPAPPGPEAGQALLIGDEANGHRLVLGRTGAGKSSLIVALVAQLINQGITCLVIDPHDLCDQILRLLCRLGFYRDERAFARVWWVPFGRPGRSPAYNVHDQPYEAHDIARNVLLALQRAWPALAAGNAPVVDNLVLAGSYVLATHRLPLTALGRLLMDAPFRDRLLAGVDDEEVIRFFRRFDASGRRAGLLSESTLRRVFNMTFSRAVHFSVGQQENRLRLRERLERGVSVLLDLSGLDEDTKRLLGCLLTVDFEVAALSRAHTPAAPHRPIHAFIDEAPVFIAQSATALEHLLAQSRKYQISVTLAAQYVAATKTLQAALQNATLIAFRLGPDDAAWASPRLFAPDPFRLKERPDMRASYMSLAEQRATFEQQLMTLPAREAYMRVGGQTTRFRTLLLPSMEGDALQAQVEAIKERYAQFLLTPHTQVEAALGADPVADYGYGPPRDRDRALSEARSEATSQVEGTNSGAVRSASPPPAPPQRGQPVPPPPHRRRTTPLRDDDAGAHGRDEA